MLHPGVFAWMKLAKNFNAQVLNRAVLEVLKEGALLNPDSEDFMKPAFRQYEKFVDTISMVSASIDLSELAKDGSFSGVNHMQYWQSVVENKNPISQFLHSIVPVAAHLLAQPAAEAVDEAAFSVAGQVMTKFRTALSPLTLEQVIVIRMFLRRKGFSPSQFDAWYMRKKVEANAAKAKKKQEIEEKKAAQPKK